jgi:hypothetical protein
MAALNRMEAIDVHRLVSRAGRKMLQRTTRRGEYGAAMKTA